MTDASPSVAFVTFGCKVNRADSEAVLVGLLSSGWSLVDEPADADVIVVNTCTVTSEADRKARKAIRRLSRVGDAPVVVMGCGVASDSGSIEELAPRVAVETDRTRVAETVERVRGGRAGRRADDGATTAARGLRARVAVKVQDGCDTRCSYCIVPEVRGPSRSTPIESVRAAVRAHVAAGTREIVVTGINLGRYDDDGRDLARLVETVAAEGPSRIRLSSVEPLDLTDRLLEILASTPSVCAHLHVPLQSAADSVLSAMGRGYTAAEYADAIERAAAALPGLVVTTDVIAGFPGETDADAETTLGFVERMGFAKLHVFRYSERVGTAAATMAGGVPARVRAARAEALRARGERLRDAYLASRAGGLAEAVVERVIAGTAHGTTRDYLKVSWPAAGVATGDVVELKLDGGVRVR